jgi:hypothetical protein
MNKSEYEKKKEAADRLAAKLRKSGFTSDQAQRRAGQIAQRHDRKNR